MLFQKLTSAQKVLLYFLPPLIVALIFLNTDNQSYKFLPHEYATKIPPSNNSNLLIMKSYERLARQINIDIDSFKLSENIAFVRIIGNKQNIFNFLLNVEKTSQILLLDFKSENNQLIVECEFRANVLQNDTIKINTNNFKSFENISSNKNSFELEKTTKNENQITEAKDLSEVPNEKSIVKNTKDEENIKTPSKPNTIAIVGKYVLINGEWLSKGDTFDGHRILEVTKTNLKLEKNGQTSIKEIFNE